MGDQGYDVWEGPPRVRRMPRVARAALTQDSPPLEVLRAVFAILEGVELDYRAAQQLHALRRQIEGR